MDREEILKRSRAEKEDEGSTFAENRGRPAEPGRLCAAGIMMVGKGHPDPGRIFQPDLYLFAGRSSDLVEAGPRPACGGYPSHVLDVLRR